MQPAEPAPEHYLQLAEAAACGGDAEQGLLLAAAGVRAAAGASAEADGQQQLLAAKLELQMLAAMCETGASNQKRWQHMQQRFRSASGCSCATRPSQGHSACTCIATRRVFAVSDVHIDRPGGANLAWMQSISTSAFLNDVLLLAGDVADTAAGVAAAFKLLAPKFWRVQWVPGNHCLWLRPDTSDRTTFADSWAKLVVLRQAADACGVDVGPLEVCPGGPIVLPLLSWHSVTFDVADPRPGRLRHDSFCDFGPVGEHDVWRMMLALNQPALSLVTAHTQQQQQQPRTHPQAEPAQRQQPEQQERPVEQPPRQHQAAYASAAGRGVEWAPQGSVLEVRSSSSSRRVPGLQVNLTKLTLGSREGAPATTPGAVSGAGDAAGVAEQLCAEARAPPVPQQPPPTPPGVITVSHFLPHPGLPHSRASELAKAMGCLELQGQMRQAASALHVFGHSHRNVDVWLPATAPALAESGSALSSTAGDGRSQLPTSSCQWAGCRYVQYALEAAPGHGMHVVADGGASPSSSSGQGGASVAASPAGLYCVWRDGQLAPGTVVPVTGGDGGELQRA